MNNYFKPTLKNLSQELELLFVDNLELRHKMNYQIN